MYIKWQNYAVVDYKNKIHMTGFSLYAHKKNMSIIKSNTTFS